jgi:hypothetical protein
MTSSSVVSVVSIVASAIVALAGVIVPQVVAGRKALSDRTIAHRAWWRDRRAELYSDMLALCARHSRSPNETTDHDSLITLQGRVATTGSPEVAALFESYVEAYRARDIAKLQEYFQRLRDHVPIELWELSKGSGNY